MPQNSDERDNVRRRRLWVGIAFSFFCLSAPIAIWCFWINTHGKATPANALGFGFIVAANLAMGMVASYMVNDEKKPQHVGEPDDEREPHRRMVASRKRDAQEKRLREKANKVVKYLGDDQRYSDGILKIERNYPRSTTIEYLKGDAPIEVFRCTGEDEERTYTYHDDIVINVRPGWLEVQGYIPGGVLGEWESHLEKLVERAEAEEKRAWAEWRARNEEEEERRRKDERERFGL